MDLYSLVHADASHQKSLTDTKTVTVLCIVNFLQPLNKLQNLILITFDSHQKKEWLGKFSLVILKDIYRIPTGNQSSMHIQKVSAPFRFAATLINFNAPS